MRVDYKEFAVNCKRLVMKDKKYDAEVVDAVLQIIENGEFEFGWEVEARAATKAPVL